MVIIIDDRHFIILSLCQLLALLPHYELALFLNIIVFNFRQQKFCSTGLQGEYRSNTMTLQESYHCMSLAAGSCNTWRIDPVNEKSGMLTLVHTQCSENENIFAVLEEMRCCNCSAGEHRSHRHNSARGVPSPTQRLNEFELDSAYLSWNACRG